MPHDELGHTDIVKRARVIGGPFGEMVTALLGCEWGRQLGTEEDHTPCPEQAVQIVVLHEGDNEFAVKLCGHHRDIVDSLTDPHAD